MSRLSEEQLKMLKDIDFPLNLFKKIEEQNQEIAELKEQRDDWEENHNIAHSKNKELRDEIKQLKQLIDIAEQTTNTNLKLRDEIEKLKANRLSEIPTIKLNCKHQLDYYEDECSKCDGLKDCRIEECDHIGTD